MVHLQAPQNALHSVESIKGREKERKEKENEKEGRKEKVADGGVRSLGKEWLRIGKKNLIETSY